MLLIYNCGAGPCFEKIETRQTVVAVSDIGPDSLDRSVYARRVPSALIQSVRRMRGVEPVWSVTLKLADNV